MTPARIGLALRLLGPILEIACIALLVLGSRRGRPFLSPGLEPLLYLGVALGLAMVAIGLSLSLPRRTRARASRQASDLEE